MYFYVGRLFHPGLCKLYSDCVKRLLQGLVISSEDLIDVLTLKDNEKGTEDLFYGIEVYRRAKVSF